LEVVVMTIDEFLAADLCDIACTVYLKNGESFLFLMDGVLSAGGKDHLTGVQHPDTLARRDAHVPCEDVTEIYLWPNFGRP
jgi:hypothetical protein